MSDINTNLEQGEQRPKVGQELKTSAAELPKQEMPQPGRIDLDTFYQTEIDRYKAEQARHYERAWETIGKAAEKNSPKPQTQEQERKPKQPSIADRIRRQALLMQARLEGVKDLSRFEELVDYFESTVDERDSKFITVPKGLSEDQKKEILGKWAAKGWNGEVRDFDNKDERHDKLYLKRTTPLRLGREHVRFIKNLVSPENNPIELAEGLRKMGFLFSEWRLKSPEEMEKLSQFFTATHAKEALELAQGISQWRYDGWFLRKWSYDERPVEVGAIDFLTQLAQNPERKAAFPPELAKKIDTLSQAFNITVGVAEIDDFQTIINNPDYLEFAAYLQGGNRRDTPVLENIIALDKAGVLKPALTLYYSGISMEPPYFSSAAPYSLRRLFDDYEAISNPQEVQQKAIKYLQEFLGQQDIQAFLQDPQKQEFAGLLVDLTGEPLPINQVSELDKLFGEGLSRKREAIYALRFMQANGVQPYSYDLERLSRMASNQHLMSTLINQDFSVFLQDLKQKTSYRLTSYYDLCDTEGKSRLVEIFDNPELKQGLLQDSTCAIIKAMHPDGHLDINRSEYYIRLAKNPNMVDTINTLRGLGYNISDTLPIIKDLEGIANNPDTLNKLKSSELNNLLRSLGSYYKFEIPDIQHLVSLSESSDKKHIIRALGLLKDNNLGISYYPHLSKYYVKLAQIPDVEDKLKEAGASLAKDGFGNNFKLFVGLRADVALYNHARNLLSDDYFKNIRDAQNRLYQFTSSISNDEIPDDDLVKMFSVCGKATELDRIALKYGINAEIAKAAQSADWQAPLLQSANFQEANEALTKMMTDLAVPVIYSDLKGEELDGKKNGLIQLAGKDKEFDNIFEICCRSVGIYGKKYPNRGQEFDVLMDGIRQSLELNLERNPKAYLQKRAELSTHQFDRIFEDIPDHVREKVMRAWFDLSPRRRLRVSGNVITAEETTLNRLNRIKDVVNNDLSVHLQELFLAKIKDLEAASARGEITGPSAEQLAIYKQYLLTPEGTVQQNIPIMYRSVETFTRNAQAALKNPETPKEEKAKLGKTLGTYQAISDSLRALYRLGTISEIRYKAQRDYLNELDKHIETFSGSLKRLRILDPERRSKDVNMRAFEAEVLLDLGKITQIMTEEGVEGQVVFETDSTVSFRDLARAPEMTQSCQRLTEVTDHNQAAYSRLLDGNDEMIDIYELKDGKKNRLARTFIELSKIKVMGETTPRLGILLDREYVNTQYQNFTAHFSNEMITHMLDRVEGVPEVSLLFDSNKISSTSLFEEALKERGYKMREVSGEYFINESNIKLTKYYDSLGGKIDVTQPSYKKFTNFYLVEKT